MKTASAFVAFALLAALVTGAPALADNHEKFYEMRTYYAAEGKFDALNARFRDHTLRIFAKHDMEVVGFWIPTDEEASKNTLIYILAFSSEEARANSWKAFGTDPEWQKVAEESQKDGRLITKIDSVMMTPTDYSPMK